MRRCNYAIDRLEKPERRGGCDDAVQFQTSGGEQVRKFQLCALSPTWTEQHLDIEDFGGDTLRSGCNQHFADQNAATLLEYVPAIR